MADLDGDGRSVPSRVTDETSAEQPGDRWSYLVGTVLFVALAGTVVWLALLLWMVSWLVMALRS
jgi:hypothetical protein